MAIGSRALSTARTTILRPIPLGTTVALPVVTRGRTARARCTSPQRGKVMSTRRHAVRALVLSLSFALPIMNGCSTTDPVNEPESIGEAGEACGSDSVRDTPAPDYPADPDPYYAGHYPDSYYADQDPDSYYAGQDPDSYYAGHYPGSYYHGHYPGSYYRGHYPGHHQGPGPYYPPNGNPGPFPPGPSVMPGVFACEGAAGPSSLVVQHDGSCFDVPQPTAAASDTYCGDSGCLPCWKLAHQVIGCELGR